MSKLSRLSPLADDLAQRFHRTAANDFPAWPMRELSDWIDDNSDLPLSTVQLDIVTGMVFSRLWGNKS